MYQPYMNNFNPYQQRLSQMEQMAQSQPIQTIQPTTPQSQCYFVSSKDEMRSLFNQMMQGKTRQEQMHRKARLMELDPKYVHVEICRWVKYTGKDVYRIRAGKKELYKIFEQEIDNLAVKD